MLRIIAPTLAFLGVAAAVYAGGDPVSGPKPGDKLTPFKVHVFTGVSAGEEVKLLTDPKETPQVIIFVHQITRPVLQLLRPVDQFVCNLAPDGLETHIVWLTADKDKTLQYLESAKQALSLSSPMVISLDADGPEKYGLNNKAAVTIVVAKGSKVVTNIALAEPNDTNVRMVNAAIAKVMGKEPPPPPDKKRGK